MLEKVNVLVIKQQHKALVISENKQVTKRGEEKRETKETEQIIREMKRKAEKDQSGPEFVIPPKDLRKVFL